jgi:hypothetical protein
MSGKCRVLKGKVIISMEEMQQKLAEVERAMKAKKKKCKNKRIRATFVDEIHDEDMENYSEDEKVETDDSRVDLSLPLIPLRP